MIKEPRKSTHSLVYCLFILAILFTGVISAQAQNNSAYTLSADDLQNDKSALLYKLPWKYHAGDEMLWAAKDFVDGDWKEITNEQINNDLSSLEGWDGRAWFRLKIRVDERLAGQPLAWRMWQWGASEIYLDGKLIQSYGTIEPHGDTEFNPRGLAFPVVFSGGGEHTIAVRYSFEAERDLSRGSWLVRGGYRPGFQLIIEPETNTSLKIENRAHGELLSNVFVGLFLALALVHFLLYLFYRAAPGNLFYSFFVAGLAVSFYLQTIFGTQHSGATVSLITDIARLKAQTVAIIALLAFLYIEFAGRPSRVFWILIALWAISAVLSISQIGNEFPHILILLLATLAVCLWIMARALANRQSGAWIIAAGVFALAFGVMFNISFERNWFHIPDWLYQLNLYLTVLSLPLTVSVYLARNYARTNHQLEQQLVQVKELSARQLEQERIEAELRIAHERTYAENERRAKELEEARQLQLSMLPKKLPLLPNLEIAAYMKPATEVGGDYYDFHVGDDGTLTVAVGDATGHGLKAGSVVTATKSLFNALAAQKDISQIFTRMSSSLKMMNLRGLFMAMTMLKIKDGAVSLSIAGMPSALIYRAANKTIEEISLRAVPLGSMTKTNYRQQENSIAADDVVLLMSDGFPEMFNAKDEMLGFEKASEILLGFARHAPQEIIDQLVKAGEQWADGRPPDDDVTFVVLKAGSDNENN